MKESRFDKKVESFIIQNDGWFVKYWGGARYTKSGIPDILACIDGHFYGIEDKNEHGRPTVLQLKNLEWIRDSGGYGILLYPKDFENFKKFVKNPIDSMNWYCENIEMQKKWLKKYT